MELTQRRIQFLLRYHLTLEGEEISHFADWNYD
jgi:hypothetical protein